MICEQLFDVNSSISVGPDVLWQHSLSTADKQLGKATKPGRGKIKRVTDGA